MVLVVVAVGAATLAVSRGLAEVDRLLARHLVVDGDARRSPSGRSHLPDAASTTGPLLSSQAVAAMTGRP